MERITREINLAESLNDAESILGSHPGKINLNTFTSPSDPAPTTREFFLNGSNLVIKEGSDPEKTITSGIEITNLIFYKIAAPSVSEGIKIELTAQKTVGKFNYSAKFTNTAILKGSY